MLTFHKWIKEAIFWFLHHAKISQTISYSIPMSSGKELWEHLLTWIRIKSKFSLTFCAYIKYDKQYWFNQIVNPVFLQATFFCNIFQKHNYVLIFNHPFNKTTYSLRTVNLRARTFMGSLFSINILGAPANSELMTFSRPLVTIGFPTEKAWEACHPMNSTKPRMKVFTTFNVCPNDV